MPPFRFRLERVLAIRRREEETAVERLAAARRRLAEAEGALADVGRRIEAATREAAETAARPVKVEALRRLHVWRTRLEADRAEAAAAVRAAEAEAEARRGAAIEASRRRRLLERLRERRRDSWRKEEEAAEDRVLDEIGTQGWLRREAGQ